MLSVLVVLAASITVSINAEDSGIGCAHRAFFNFSVIVQRGEVVTVSLYGDGGLIEQKVFNYQGVFTDGFGLGNFDGSVDTRRWHTTCVWIDGAPPYRLKVHDIIFPEDFKLIIPYKMCVHGFHF